jgi:multidrug efflux pump subunit AcrA (membrane-fusion protein)
MKKLLVLIVVVLLLAGGAILLKKRKAVLASAEPAPPLPVVVDTVRVENRPLLLTVPAMGVVSSDLSVTLATKVSGRVTRLFRNEGDRVAKGELVAAIDDTDLKAKLAALEMQQVNLDYEIASKTSSLGALRVALANAVQSHDRTKAMLEVKGASIEEFQAEQTGIASLEAQVTATENGISALNNSKRILAQNEREIKALLAYTELVSPVAGTLSVSHVQPGDMALPGAPLFRITAAGPLYVNLQLPSDLTAKEIMLNGRRLPLVPKNVAAQNGLRQYRSLLAGDTGAVEGDLLQVSVVTYRGKGCLIPLEALLSINGSDYVFVYDGAKAKKRPVTILHRGVEGVCIQEDLGGKRLLAAMPDILLRVSSGVPVRIDSERP